MSHRVRLRRAGVVCAGTAAALALGSGVTALAGEAPAGDADGLLPTISPSLPLPSVSLPVPLPTSLPPLPPGTTTPPTAPPTTVPPPPTGTPAPTTPAPGGDPGGSGPGADDPGSGGGAGGDTGGTKGGDTGGGTANGGRHHGTTRGPGPSVDPTSWTGPTGGYGVIAGPSLLSGAQLGLGHYGFAAPGVVAPVVRPPLVAGPPQVAVAQPAADRGTGGLGMLAGSTTPGPDDVTPGLAVILATAALGLVSAGHVGYRRRRVSRTG